MTTNDLTFQYFIGDESEQFTFIKVPKIFFTEKYFDELSYGAKILYGLLLDRMGLSKRNGWKDNNNRIYVIYTIGSIQKDFHISKTIAIRFMKELEDFGLIEKKKRPNAPTLLYVKNFIAARAKEEESLLMKGSPENGLPEVLNMEVQNVEVQNMEVQNMDFQKHSEESGSPYYGLPEHGLPEVHNMDSNKTNINKTIDDDISSSEEKNLMQEEDEKVKIRNRINCNKIMPKADQDDVDNLIDSLAQIFQSSKKEHKIDGELVSMDEIKKRIWETLDEKNFQLVLHNIKFKGSTTIYNFQNYVIACFLNLRNISEFCKSSSGKYMVHNFLQNTYDFEQLEKDLLINAKEEILIE